MEDGEPRWGRLCGKAVQLCGTQAQFRTEAAILKRLMKKYGAVEVERMLDGAKALGWTSLKSLGSAEGLGRRMAVARFWMDERKAKIPERVKGILWNMLKEEAP